MEAVTRNGEDRMLATIQYVYVPHSPGSSSNSRATPTRLPVIASTRELTSLRALSPRKFAHVNRSHSFLNLLLNATV